MALLYFLYILFISVLLINIVKTEDDATHGLVWGLIILFIPVVGPSLYLYIKKPNLVWLRGSIALFLLFDRVKKKTYWICKECGTENTSEHFQCWSCQRER